MDTIIDRIERARSELQQQILDKIAEVEDFSEFFTTVEIMFMHVGLDLKKEGKEFLKSRNWSNATRRDEYMAEIEAFLKTHIK